MSDLTLDISDTIALSDAVGKQQDCFLDYGDYVLYNDSNTFFETLLMQLSDSQVYSDFVAIQLNNGPLINSFSDTIIFSDLIETQLGIQNNLNFNDIFIFNDSILLDLGYTVINMNFSDSISFGDSGINGSLVVIDVKGELTDYFRRYLNDVIN